ncbi:MAG: methionyl-tRNA formyltransferase [Ferrimicrobium sp.]
MRIGFFGTGPISAVYLSALVEAGYEVSSVITKAAARRGRSATATPTAVFETAAKLGIATSIDYVGDYDLGVVVAFGRLIPAWLVESVPLINVHYSLLPYYRGAAPVERAILDGLSTSGVTVMRIVPELDAGPVLSRHEVAIEGMTSSLAREALTKVGVEALITWLDSHGIAEVDRGSAQTDAATYAPKITGEDLRLRMSESAQRCVRRVRLERAYLFVGTTRLRVLDAQVEDDSEDLVGHQIGTLVTTPSGRLGIQSALGVFVPLQVRPEGKATMAFMDFVRGYHGAIPPISATPTEMK